MRLTESEYQNLLASRKTQNTRTLRKSESGAWLQLATADEAEERAQGEGKASYRVVILSRRKRAIDPDNLCPKWFIDELVKAGYLPDDSSRYVASIEKRVEISCEEETIVEIWKESNV